MTNQIAVFNFQSNTVRTITDEKGELWFLGNDVCNILGYANPRRTIDLHCKTGGVTKRYTPTESGEQEMTYINEPNLYRLIVKSRKTEAEKFEEWVMEEVLPTIRKTGSYYLKISETQRKTLADAVRSRCGYEKSHYSKVWKAVKDFFQVEVYSDIPASGFNQALQII